MFLLHVLPQPDSLGVLGVALGTGVLDLQVNRVNVILEAEFVYSFNQNYHSLIQQVVES